MRAMHFIHPTQVLQPLSESFNPTADKLGHIVIPHGMHLRLCRYQVKHYK